MDSEDFWELRPGLPGVFDFLRLSALFVGYLLAGVGWLGFFTALLISVYVYLDDGILLSARSAGFFQVLGNMIVGGWLLLRFAASLFPFGRHLFRWQKTEQKERGE
jgi:hypothetical protein